jgi:hypothetical protein
VVPRNESRHHSYDDRLSEHIACRATSQELGATHACHSIKVDRREQNMT